MPRWSGVLARITVSHVGDANLHHLSRGAALPSSARRPRGTGQPILLAQGACWVGWLPPTHHALHVVDFDFVVLLLGLVESVFAPSAVVGLVDDLEGPMVG